VNGPVVVKGFTFSECCSHDPSVGSSVGLTAELTIIYTLQWFVQPLKYTSSIIFICGQFNQPSDQMKSVCTSRTCCLTVGPTTELTA